MSSIFEYFPSSRIELFELGEDEEKTLVHIFCAKKSGNFGPKMISKIARRYLQVKNHRKEFDYIIGLFNHFLV